MNVLAVDRDRATRLQLHRAFNSIGLDVDDCASAEEALALIQHKSYSVIITEWSLPGLDGLSLCRELRRRGVRSGLVVLSERGSLTERVEAFSAHIDDYHTKPAEIAELRLKVDALARRVHEAQS